MKQLVLQAGRIVAVHDMHQDIADMYPGCEIVTHDRELPVDGIGGWLPDDPRTDEEKKLEYLSQRRLAYPPLADQLDMIYHDTVNGTHTWEDTIAAVKEQFPQPVKTPE